MLSRLIRDRGFWAVLAPVLAVVGLNTVGFCFSLISQIAGFGLFLLLLIGALWVRFSGTSLRLERKNVLLVCAVILLSVPLTRWPVCLVLAVSQPAMDDLSDRVVRGEILPFPRRAGLITVTSAEMSDLGTGGYLQKVPVLWTGRDYGFARASYADNWYGSCGLSHLNRDWAQVDED